MYHTTDTGCHHTCTVNDELSTSSLHCDSDYSDHTNISTGSIIIQSEQCKALRLKDEPDGMSCSKREHEDERSISSSIAVTSGCELS